MARKLSIKSLEEIFYVYGGANRRTTKFQNAFILATCSIFDNEQNGTVPFEIQPKRHFLRRY